jgi:hypothetical protein
MRQAATGVYVLCGDVGNTNTSDGDNKIEKILNKVFDTIIALTMFLCFFALSANMSANLF